MAIFGTLVLCSLGGITTAKAQSILDRSMGYRTEVDCANHTDCKTALGSVAASAGSTAYAMKKFKDAKNLEKAHTAVLGEWSEGHQPDSFRTQAIVGNVADGDKVVVHYNLSYAENRLYHIDLYEKKSAAAKSSADFHATQAVAAAIPRAVTHIDTTTDSEGRVSTTTRVTFEADHAGVLMHTSLATNYRQDAINYMREADAVRSGQKQAPMHTLEKAIEDDAGNRKLAHDFVNERVARDGKILKVTRLPAETLRQVRKIVKVAKGGVVGAVTMGLVAAEETVVGYGAEKVDQLSGSGKWSPSARNWRTGK